MSHLARPITKDEVAAYRHAGVVLLRGVLSLPAVNALRRSIDDPAEPEWLRSQFPDTRS